MNQKWIAVLALVAGVGGVSMWWASNHEQAQAPMASEPASAPALAQQSPASAAAPVASSASLAGLVAQQAAAAKEIEREPGMKPIVGPVKERPAFVSEIEWQMVKGVAQQNVSPDLELTRLVNNLRFMKQLELWQGMGPSTDAAKRQALAEDLLADLPQRVSAGEMAKADATKLQANLLKDAVSDASKRKARAEVEARRLVPPAPTASAQTP